jgi:hypothetical protein
MPLVTRTVALIALVPAELQVAPVMPPDPLLVLLLLEELLLEELDELVLLLLDDDEPVFEYEQYRGLSTPIDGNNEAWQVIGPVSVAYTNVPDLP